MGKTMRSHPTTTDLAAPTESAEIAPIAVPTYPVLSDEAQIGRLFEMTSDLLAAISLDGRFTLLNPAWEEALGWSIEELKAHRWESSCIRTTSSRRSRSRSPDTTGPRSS
jgi:PAS domain-containing protein